MMTSTIDKPKVNFRSKISSFVNNHPNEFLMCFLLVLMIAVFSIMTMEIENQKSIARGIFIESKFQKIMSGELSLEDYKIMKEIDFKSDNVMEQLDAFKKKFD